MNEIWLSTRRIDVFACCRPFRKPSWPDADGVCFKCRVRKSIGELEFLLTKDLTNSAFLKNRFLF